MIPFDTLPDDARLWVFPAREPITGRDASRLLERVDTFLADWQAHGHPLTVGRDWRDDRFLLVAVDERSEPPSGCSIDAFVRVLKALEDDLGLDLTDHGRVFYRAADGAIASLRRPDFAALARAGDVSPDTTVFDTTVTRLSDLRGSRFELPAREAWHQRVFFRRRADATG
jgi:hypothetical protein